MHKTETNNTGQIMLAIVFVLLLALIFLLVYRNGFLCGMRHRKVPRIVMETRLFSSALRMYEAGDSEKSRYLANCSRCCLRRLLTIAGSREYANALKNIDEYSDKAKQNFLNKVDELTRDLYLLDAPEEPVPNVDETHFPLFFLHSAEKMRQECI